MLLFLETYFYLAEGKYIPDFDLDGAYGEDCGNVINSMYFGDIFPPLM